MMPGPNPEDVPSSSRDDSAHRAVETELRQQQAVKDMEERLEQTMDAIRRVEAQVRSEASSIFTREQELMDAQLAMIQKAESRAAAVFKRNEELMRSLLDQSAQVTTSIQTTAGDRPTPPAGSQEARKA